MAYLADVYVLAPRRAASLVRLLVAHFLPNGATSAQADCTFADGSVFDDPWDAVAVAEERHRSVVSIYWLSSGPAANASAHCFFTEDGGLVLGVSRPEATGEARLLSEMKEIFSAEYGYVDYEAPPEYSVAAFIERSKKE